MLPLSGVFHIDRNADIAEPQTCIGEPPRRPLMQAAQYSEYSAGPPHATFSYTVPHEQGTVVYLYRTTLNKSAETRRQLP